MLRTIFMIGLFAFLGLFALKVIFGILPWFFALIWWVLGLALNLRGAIGAPCVDGDLGGVGVDHLEQDQSIGVTAPTA